MPPPAPRTATFVCRAEEEEKARAWVDKRRVAERVNMAVKMVATSSRWQKHEMSELMSGIQPVRVLPSARVREEARQICG